jgi:hypothetical protein
MKSGQHTEIDYEAVAEKWFGQREPADKLRSVIQDMARLAHDSANYGTPSQRKTKLRSAASWATKLKTLLSEMDPTTRVQLFGAGEVGSSAGESELVFKVRPAQNADALPKLREFETLLDEMAARAGRFAQLIGPQTAGARNLPDAIAFGVACLASFWRKYRDEDPTSGQNYTSFGYLAELVFCPPPVSAKPSQVQTALRYYFKKAKLEAD